MSKTILIVDDSSSLRQVVKMSLTASGHTVLEANDGVSALKLMDGRIIDMIISDVNMPGMNGLDFCRQAKSLSLYKYTPILMLTTEVSEEKKAQGKAAGAAGWMPKPFSPSQLNAAVLKLIK